MDVGGMGDDSELQNNVQESCRAVASPVLASKGSSDVDGNGGSNSGDSESSPVALHSEAGGGVNTTTKMIYRNVSFFYRGRLKFDSLL